MTPESFDFIAGLVKGRSGLLLTPDKRYMLESRLTTLLKREALADLDALALRLRDPRSGPLAEAVTEALTTNESSFFRDGKPFDHLKRALPKLVAARPPGSTIRVWSAACSTGQEAYSVAMIVAELGAEMQGRRVEIIGTDIAGEVLARARDGVFSQFEVQRGLPVRQLVRHFSQEQGRWRVSAELKAMTRFDRCNLLGDLRSMGRFDVIFCRNVLIYFDAPTKAEVFERIAQTMNPGGFLLLGAAESVIGITQAFETAQDRRGLYKLVNRAAKVA